MRRRILAMMLSTVLTVSVLSPCVYAADVTEISEEQSVAEREADMPLETEKNSAEEEKSDVSIAEVEQDETLLDGEEIPETEQEKSSEEEIVMESGTETEQNTQASEDETLAEPEEETLEVVTEASEENIPEPDSELTENVEEDVKEEISEEPMTAEAVEYNLIIDSDTENYITVKPGENIDLEVLASAEEGSLSYKWHVHTDGWHVVEGETNAVLHLTDITANRKYECIVTDDYGNSEEVYFEVYVDSGLTASAESHNINVKFMENTVLKVLASVNAGKLSYQWYREDAVDGDSVCLEGETKATLSLTIITRSGRYWCKVKDDYGNQETVYFTISVNDSLVILGDAENYITVKAGKSIDLTVSASVEAGNIFYQWYKDGLTELEGENEATLSLTNVTEESEYRCVVMDDYGNSKSVFFYVSVNGGLIVSGKRENYITVKPLEGVDLTVTANVDVGNLSYQWYGDKPLYGETGAVLSLTGITKNSRYWCEIKDDYGNSEEVYFYISVNSGLMVSSKRENYITVKPMESVDLTVTASVDEGNISYQWYNDNGTKLEEKEETLHLSEITKDDKYCCYIRDDYGTYVEIYFSITVDSGFRIYNETKNYMTVKPSESAELLVTANVDTGNLSYQWYGDGLLEGETEATLHLSNIRENEVYSCNIEDNYGHSKTVWFYITVDGGLTVYNDAKSYITIRPLDDVDLTVSACVNTGDLSYQWYDDGNGKLSGETGATLHLTGLSKSRAYYCYVKDDYGNGKKIYFDVTVDSGLTLYEVPYKKITVKPGESADLTVNASVDSGTISYQWYRNNLIGTEATLHLTNITENATYYCYVEDDYGNKEQVRFEFVVDSGFLIDYDAMETDLTVVSGESVDLTVVARTGIGEISYNWVDDDEEKGAVLHLSDVTESGIYSCWVSDQYHSVKIEFTIKVAGSFYVDRNAIQTNVVVPYGSSADLSVVASSPEESIAYQWYDKDEQEFPEATGAVLHLQKVTKSGIYYCDISDSNNSVSVGFYVLCIPDGDMETLHEGEKKLTVIEDANICKIYKVVPEKTGEYVFGWTDLDALIWIFDENMNRITRSDRDGMKQFYQLTAGKTYYYLLQSDWGETGGFSMFMEKVEEGTACIHEWDRGNITKTATCTALGTKTYTCLNCKKTKTEPVPAIGHDSGTMTVIKAATCMDFGTRVQKCTRCNAVLKTESIPATGHKAGAMIVTKAATCTETGTKEQKCTACNAVLKTETIPANGHSWSEWKTTEKATVFKAAAQTRTCSACQTSESRTYGSKAKATMKVSASSLTLKTGQSTTALKVTGLANGDYVKSWKAKNISIVKVTGKKTGTCTIKAQKKTGSTSIVITLASGKTKTIKVKVQKSAVATTKITGISKKLTLKKGKSVTLKPVIAPITSTQKVTYKTSDQKVVTVNSKGKLTAKKKGKATITITSGKKSVKCTVTVK